MDGMVTLKSAFGPTETMDRFQAAVSAKGMAVFARVDHAKGAAEVGLKLLPTELLIFGSARAGTPLMQQDQRIGLDLPLKALVWQDDSAETWLTYKDPGWVVLHHGLAAGNPIASAMAAALAALAAAAVGA
ncbi:MAG: DUF302 domain-containing protein [Polyangiaceae bacterium]